MASPLIHEAAAVLIADPRDHLPLLFTMSDDEEVKAEEHSPEETETAEEVKGETLQPEKEPSTTVPKVEEEEDLFADNQDETPATNGTEAPAPISAPRPSDPRLSVPRKVPSTPPASDPRSPTSASSFHGSTTSETGTSLRPGYPGNSVGLPAGITVPRGVDSKLLQGRLLDTLKQLPDDLIIDALNEYDDALQNKGGSIRNQGAYLYGVIKRYVNVQERAASGNADHVMGKALTPEVTVRFIIYSPETYFAAPISLTALTRVLYSSDTLG